MNRMLINDFSSHCLDCDARNLVNIPVNQLDGSSFRLKIAKIAQNPKGTTVFNRSRGSTCLIGLY